MDEILVEHIFSISRIISPNFETLYNDKRINRKKRTPQNVFHCIWGYAKQHLNKDVTFHCSLDMFRFIYEKNEAIGIYLLDIFVLNIYTIQTA